MEEERRDVRVGQIGDLPRRFGIDVERGADDVIVKPFSTRELCAHVGRQLARRRRVRDARGGEGRSRWPPRDVMAIRQPDQDAISQLERQQGAAGGRGAAAPRVDR